MYFQSILFKNIEDYTKTQENQKNDFFRDLNLDQIIDAITSKKEKYDLLPFFYTPLKDLESISYRHEVMRDMENADLFNFIKIFCDKMTIIKQYMSLVEKLDLNYHKKGWFLEAVLEYCQAMIDLTNNLNSINLKSNGFLKFNDYIKSYINSKNFKSLLTESQNVKNLLLEITYCITVKSGKFTVTKYNEETDYSAEVEKVFEKFKQGGVKDYKIKSEKSIGMNHIEAKILEFVAKLYPKEFDKLDYFYTNYNQFLDGTIKVFDREIQFYVAYLDYISILKKNGLKFCYPLISETNKEIHAYETFDLALAQNRKSVVCNDFFLQNMQRILVISGPNQGGKTTFARTFGQLHYLARLGCLTPGINTQLFLYDNIFTHFEREENIHNLQGKLQEELVRMHDIFEKITPKSILIVNEIFSSTTLKDALFLSTEIMEKVIKLDLLCVWVTFIDELSTLSEKTVSMVSTVLPENPTIRTFKLERKPADGLVYALSLAKKHYLTYEQIKGRLRV